MIYRFWLTIGRIDVRREDDAEQTHWELIGLLGTPVRVLELVDMRTGRINLVPVRSVARVEILRDEAADV